MKTTSTALAVLFCLAASHTALAGGTEIKAYKGDQRLILQEGNSPLKVSTTTWTSVTATTPIKVPAGQSGYLVVTFTGESQCNGPKNSWCSVKLSCDGIDLEPAAGTDFAFSSGGQEEWVSASVMRRSGIVTGGDNGTLHPCEIHTAVVNGATEHVLDDWTFMVEFWRQ